MELKGDIGLYLSGQPVKIDACGIYIIQPKIKDIVQFGEQDFFTIVKMFHDITIITETIKQGNSVLNEVPDFQILIELLRDEKGEIRKYANMLFQLCCPDFLVEYSAHSIDFKIEEKGVTVGMLNSFTYSDFAETLGELFLPQLENQENVYHIDESNIQSKRLLEKIKKNRERLAKASSQKDGNISLFGLYSSILSIGLQIDINAIYNYTPFQLYDSFKRLITKYQRDRYESMLLVPFADTKSLQENPVDSWFENLYKPEQENYNSLEKLNKVGNTA